MFIFVAVLAMDRLEWQMSVDNPEPSVADFKDWVERAGPTVVGYTLWPDEARRRMIAFGWGRAAETQSTIEGTIRQRLGDVVPFGRLVDVSVALLDSDEELQEAQRGMFGVFSSPGGRCPGCGKTEPPHHPGCPWDR